MNCQFCGQELLPSKFHPNQKYCSHSCARKAWVPANRETLNAYYARWEREWRRKNPEKARARDKRINLRHRLYRHRWTAERKLEVLNQYGGPICVCCGEQEFDFLTIEHSRGDGNLHRKTVGVKAGTQFYGWLFRSGFPQDIGLEVLCWNCQIGRKIGQGICPHETVTER